MEEELRSGGRAQVDWDPHIHGRELGAEYGLCMLEKIIRLSLACTGGFQVLVFRVGWLCWRRVICRHVSCVYGLEMEAGVSFSSGLCYVFRTLTRSLSGLCPLCHVLSYLSRVRVFVCLKKKPL